MNKTKQNLQPLECRDARGSLIEELARQMGHLLGYTSGLITKVL
jgi:hypothetical protein